MTPVAAALSAPGGKLLGFKAVGARGTGMFRGHTDANIAPQPTGAEPDRCC